MQDQLITIPGARYRLALEHTEQGSLIRLLEIGKNELLHLELGPRGPVLHLGGGLGIAVAGELRFEAERVDIRGRDGVCLHSEGDTVIHSDGDMVADARQLDLKAGLGDVRVSANDDVKLVGERIRLNC